MKPSRLVLIVVFGLATALDGLAQTQPKLDSLARQLQAAPADTNRVTALIDLGYERLGVGQNQIADSLAVAANALSRKLVFRRGEANSLTLRGRIAYQQADYPTALRHYEQALSLVTKYHLAVSSRQSALANVAMILQVSGQQERALAMAQASIQLFETYKLPKLKGSPYDIAGAVLHLRGNDSLALRYFRQGLDIKTKEENYTGMAISANRIGGLLADQGQYKQALLYLKQAEQNAEKGNNLPLVVDVLLTECGPYRQLKQYPAGFAAMQKAIVICRQVNSPHQLGAALGNLGQLYMDAKAYDKSETYLKQGLSVVEKVGSVEYQMYLHGALMELYEAKGDYRQAFASEKKYRQFQDSVVTAETKSQIDELNTRYETSKKETQIKLLQKEKQLQTETAERSSFRFNALVVGSLLLLGLGIAIAAWLLNRAKLRRLEDAQRLRKQIAHDLHDEIGSTLSSISLLSGMVNDMAAQNRPDTARRMVEKIHTDARQILNAMDEIVWTINPGNDALRPVALRLREYAQPLFDAQHIHLTLDVPTTDVPMSMDVRRNLYLIGKEAINNAAKYAQATEVTIRFSQVAGQLSVLIEDNGRGFDPAQPSDRTGQQSMQARAEAIGGRLSVESSPGQGTRVAVSVG